MPPMSSKVDPIALAEKVFAILSSGSFSSTYKYALLLAIIDLCIEKVGRKKLPGESVTITTHELAEQVVELYWPQCAPWDGEVLRQGGGRGEQAKILRSITGFRAGLQGTKSPSLCLAKRDFPGEYLRLLQDVEWVLIEMPIPRLQRVASQEYRFLYDHACDDAKKSHVAGYQRGEASEFNNLLTLRPGVADGLVALNGVLRPIIQREWLREVQRRNKLGQADLEDFFFGRERESLKKVRGPLLQIQSGRCFFCDTKVADQPEVDHFLPWARFPTNLVENLVVAHASCNGSKSDFLASGRHVINWTARAKTHQGVLEKIGTDYGLGSDGARIVKVAAVIYGQLPDASLLWDGKKKFEPLDRDKVLKLFRAA